MNQVPDEMVWHVLPSEKVCLELGVDVSRGLDEEALIARRARYGPNSIATRSGESALLRFMRQMHQPLVYILNGSALISAIMGEWVDAGVIFGVVLVNAIMGFLQEARALSAISALARALVSEATVLRGGQKRRIDAVDLVPGDVVLLASGDRVPADLRLLRTKGLAIEEAALTGESVPAKKLAGSVDLETGLADRHNMAYGSTLVVSGTALAVVVATGPKSELGRISDLIDSQELLDTPLTRKMAEFSMLLLYVILGLALLTFVVGILRGQSMLPMFMAAVALAVGAIPEGLPAAITITLAIGVGRMAKRRAIVRKLPAVETLGSTTVICSDKTGTLTLNQMSVRALELGSLALTLDQVGYAPEGHFLLDGTAIDPKKFPGVLEQLRAGLLCNDAVLFREEGEWKVEGDPTEAALIASAGLAGLTHEEQDVNWPRLDVLPFESEHQFMATLHGNGKQAWIYLKGSAEKLLPWCSDALAADGSLTTLDGAAIEGKIHARTDEGLRVLVFARKSADANASHIDAETLNGLTYLGFQAMSDPPRAEVIEAIAACQRAGILVKMITGDHLGTATAIAREVGLLNQDIPVDEQVIGGNELTRMDDELLAERVERLNVFARVAPEQKLRLVKALQARGHVVAMTGDGTNDAPALRRGDIGVAMGRSGTEVSREAADMVLTDDNFASIEAAVEEGRGVFDNLIKFITWTLPTNIGMGLVILAAVFSGATLPILPVQILWINMTTVILLGLTLAFEPKEPGIMLRAPRKPSEPILTNALVGRIILVGLLLLAGSFGLFRYELARGLSEEVARTTASNVFVIGEIFYLFNCRSLTQSMWRIGLFSNPLLIWGCLLMLVLQLAYTYLPLMNDLFGSAAVDASSWAWTLVCGAVIYLVIGFEKWLRGRFRSAPSVISAE